MNEICADQGVPLSFTGETLIRDYVGMNFRGMLNKLREQHSEIKLSDEQVEVYVKKEEDAVIAKLRAALKPCPGVDAELEKLAEHKKYHLAVVSSSALRRVKASIEVVGHDKYFHGEHVFSAATSLPKPTSKPDPAIYLHAMAVLGKKAEECVAIEDSKSGTMSATRAGIKVVGYVGPYSEDERPEMEKVLRDAGALVTMSDWSEFESCLDKLEAGSY